MAKRAPRTGGTLSGISVIDLHAELGRRQRRVGALERRRDRAMSKVQKLDAEIAALGGSVSGSGRTRPRNASNLVEALHKLLDGKTMSVTEATAEVQKAGYITTSATFRTIVNQTLINSGQFKRVARGQYTSK